MRRITLGLILLLCGGPFSAKQTRPLPCWNLFPAINALVRKLKETLTPKFEILARQSLYHMMRTKPFDNGRDEDLYLIDFEKGLFYGIEPGDKTSRLERAMRDIIIDGYSDPQGNTHYYQLSTGVIYLTQSGKSGDR